MALSSGTVLGVYRIGGLLGKGGMGEVYRAHDEKLARDVAVKVLPPEFATDSDRFARFGREARLLASLSHPNIAGIHGLEAAGETHFLVLELIEGETLAERLGRPLSTELALKLALQIAAALEAAHAKGIIHRDLKPGNIKIAPDGTVKVLDFGLAKASEETHSAPDLSHSPTLSMTATAKGVILGTAGYMAPEQARGEAVTKQADIWAFGCILFEMLSGRRVWEGRSVTDVIAALVAREPDWRRLPPALHPRLRFLLERCLEKEPANRYHEIADVRVEIAKALAEPNAGAAGVTAPRPKTRALAAWAVATTAALAIIAAAMFVGWYLRPEASTPVARFDLALPEALPQPTVPPFTLVAVAKNGMRWAISTQDQLYVRNLGQSDARALQGITAQAIASPTFSPDGEWLAYVEAPSMVSATGLAIRKLPVSGGTPQTIVRLTNVTTPPAFFGVDVSWDDRNMLTWVEPQGIMQVSANGGEPELIVAAGEGEALASPQVLPGGEAILFTVTRTAGFGRWDAAEIAIQSLGSTERTVVWRGGRDARYVASGHIVYAQGNTLFAMPFDLERRMVNGDQVPVVEGLSTPAGGPAASDTAQFAVSDSGALLYLTGGAAPAPGAGNRPPPRGIAWVDRKGIETPIRIRPDDYTLARLSPDGSKVALVIGNPIPGDSNTDIWVYDFATENSRQLTFQKFDDDGPVWTADSKRLFFRSFLDAEERAGVYSVSADGGAPTLVAKADDFNYALPWSLAPDQRSLALVHARSLQEVGLARLELQDTPAFHPLLSGPAPIVNEPVIAANGQWLAYHESSGPGTAEVNIRPYPDVERQRYPVAPGMNPVFSRSGSELFFFDGKGLSVVPVSYQPTLRIGAAQQLFQGQYWYGVAGANGNLGRAWDVDPRGERFLMIRMPGAVTVTGGAAAPPPVRVNVVLNWVEELKARAPAR